MKTKYFLWQVVGRLRCLSLNKPYRMHRNQ